MLLEQLLRDYAHISSSFIGPYTQFLPDDNLPDHIVLIRNTGEPQRVYGLGVSVPSLTIITKGDLLRVVDKTIFGIDVILTNVKRYTIHNFKEEESSSEILSGSKLRIIPGDKLFVERNRIEELYSELTQRVDPTITPNSFVIDMPLPEVLFH